MPKKGNRYNLRKPKIDLILPKQPASALLDQTVGEENLFLVYQINALARW